MRARGEGSSPGRVEGSSCAMLATARPSCFESWLFILFHNIKMFYFVAPFTLEIFISKFAPKFCFNFEIKIPSVKRPYGKECWCLNTGSPTLAAREQTCVNKVAVLCSLPGLVQQRRHCQVHGYTACGRWAPNPPFCRAGYWRASPPMCRHHRSSDQSAVDKQIYHNYIITRHLTADNVPCSVCFHLCPGN